MAAPAASRIQTLLKAMEEMLHSILTEQQWEKFLAQRELDFSTSFPTGARFRGNLLYHGQTAGALFRAIPTEPPSLDASLLVLVRAGKVSAPQAIPEAISVELFKPLVGVA